jgi:hypothetical protein
VANAIEDALQPYGVVVREAPVTAARFWRLLSATS